MSLPSQPQKSSYHHGNLAQTLVDAATQLVAEKGPEHFNMADASRVAGVSKGAPYRHFDSKEALLRAVVDGGFERFADKLSESIARYPEGSDERVVTVGLTYIDFATSEPAIFRMMFGNNLQRTSPSERDYPRCFKILLSEISARTGLTDQRDLLDVARPLWTLVHGASMLTIDNNYMGIDPHGNTEEMIRTATELILLPYKRPEHELQHEVQ